jgi:hypothetical protein
MGTTATYVLTHNSPAQLSLLLESFAAAAPDLLTQTEVVVVNQSTRPLPEYDAVCERFGVTQVRVPNRGASGGRFTAARLFAESSHERMFFFEDDLVLRPPTADVRCRFGFPGVVPDLYSVAQQIVTAEDLAYLKLTFHELFYDHSRDFLTNRPAAFEKLGHLGVGYFVGDVYYSNWPMLITRAGSAALFHEPTVTEGQIMARAAERLARGEFRAGVLAAFPVEHTRLEHDRPDKTDLA